MQVLGSNLVTTDAAGIVQWNFPWAPTATTPAISAVAVATTPVFVTVRGVNINFVRLSAWDAAGAAVPNQLIIVTAFVWT